MPKRLQQGFLAVNLCDTAIEFVDMPAPSQPQSISFHLVRVRKGDILLFLIAVRAFGCFLGRPGWAGAKQGMNPVTPSCRTTTLQRRTTSSTSTSFYATIFHGSLETGNWTLPAFQPQSRGTLPVFSHDATAAPNADGGASRVPSCPRKSRQPRGMNDLKIDNPEGVAGRDKCPISNNGPRTIKRPARITIKAHETRMNTGDSAPHTPQKRAA